ncbi:ABC transporter substrate-binding protein [Priestia megaterium]|uniref:ABC transporter substrate-binding protein n=1 Tax=Priestia megaterium TaxID=1404 RepID=UPI002E2199ED|nr:ABC transporter substrate-binding protein [Priestia megaterium]
MKMKRLSIMSGLLATSLLFATACSNSGTDSKASKSTGSGDQVVIDMFQFKVEIADQLKELTDEYTKEHPNVKFNIQTVGGGADYGAALKAQFASGNEPDIFNNGGFQEAQTWKDKLEDLSDQPWVDNLYDIAKEPMTMDGKIYGQPLNLEGYGFIYNKDLFEKAGIKELPKTLSELEAASKKLKAKGITPFSNGYGEWWVLGNHLFNIPMAQQDDPDAFIKGLNEGKAKFEGNETFKQFMNLFDLTLKYGNKNPLTTDYNTQVTQFASGETAMMQQGNWTVNMITKINPDMKMGFIPMPISNDAKKNDKLAIGVPNNWVVNKNAPDADKKAAKEFLNWMVSSKEGQKFLVEKFKFIPAFKNIDGKGIDSLSDDILKYSEEGKTLSWNWFKYPEGTVQEVGAAMQSYAGKQMTEEEFMKKLDTIWTKMKK